jgi:hypothetical protein
LQPVVASFSQRVALSAPVVLGTRLCAANPSIKALFEEEDEYAVLEEAISQQDEEIDLLLFAPDGAEVSLNFLRAAVGELNSAIKAPLLLCTENPDAIETLCRVYNGKPLLVFPQGEKAQIAALAAAKKYGAVLVGEVQGVTAPTAPAFSGVIADLCQEEYLPVLAVSSLVE